MFNLFRYILINILLINNDSIHSDSKGEVGIV